MNEEMTGNVPDGCIAIFGKANKIVGLLAKEGLNTPVLTNGEYSYAFFRLPKNRDVEDFVEVYDGMLILGPGVPIPERFPDRTEEQA